MVPRSVGPWEIRSVIGRGGIGIVYRARHHQTGRTAAVKLLGPAPVVDPRAARRLAREYEVLRALDHPNVVRVYEAGVAEGYSYLAMELVDGLDLRAFLSPVMDQGPVPVPLTDPSMLSLSGGDAAQVGPDAIRTLATMLEEPDTALPEFHPPAPSSLDGAAAPAPLKPLDAETQAAMNRRRRLFRLAVALGQVLDALAYVHDRGLVHRDLKPSNIMVDDRRQARIMDFGLVKDPETQHDEPLTGSGRVVGTYRYMAPEQAQGHTVDRRTDLYSLGIILYELLAGTPPFVSQDPAALWHELLEAPPTPLVELNPGVDPGLAAIAMRCLEKDPGARFGSAQEILQVLARWSHSR